MKTIKMDRDFSYRARARVFVQYKAGAQYERVPEAAAKEIIEAGAGKIIEKASN